MVRRNLYHREDVVAAALAVVREHGFGQLTARRVADRLGASTAPVYSNFANMEDLAGAVKLAIADLVLAETAVSRSGEPFLDMGLGVLAFARSSPELYNAVFSGHADPGGPGLRILRELLARMGELDRLAELDINERRILLRKVAIFTHGLAWQMAAGRADQVSWAEIQLLLREVGQAMIDDAFSRPPRSPGEIALLGNLCESRPETPDAGPALANLKETHDA